MHVKIRLRDDSRLDGVLFFEDEMMMVAHIKSQNGNEGYGKATDEKTKKMKKDHRGVQVEKLDSFKKVESLISLNETFKDNEVITFKIFDKIKVLVETTTEFPLDVKCKLLITNEDFIFFEECKKKETEKASSLKKL